MEERQLCSLVVVVGVRGVTLALSGKLSCCLGTACPPRPRDGNNVHNPKDGCQYCYLSVGRTLSSGAHLKPPSNLEVASLTAQGHLAGKCRAGAQSQICATST